MLLIKNGRVVDPVLKTDDRRDILIRDGRIVMTGKNLAEREALSGRITEQIDAANLIVAPGLMDAHVHFRDPGFTYKEDIYTGAAAAAAGGFTTVVCMANTKPVVDCVEVLKANQRKGEQTGIHVLQASAITRGLEGKELVDMDAMAENGAVGFTDDGIPLMNEELLVRAMKKAASLDLPISLHEEDPLWINGAGVHAGKVARQLGYGGASSAAEEVMVARDCMLALHTGASVCIQHISSGRSVQLVRLAKSMGADIHAEATPHHFTLTEEAVLQYGANARMNPPLRTEEDRLMLIEGLRDGTIDMIVTDHAPHSCEEKSRPIAEAPSGIIGLETSLGLGIRELVEPGFLTLTELLEKMTVNPAEFYRMIPFGISEGEPADLVLFDLSTRYKAEKFASKANNSPFLGWELPGKVFYTICKGQIVFRGGDDVKTI